MINSSASINIDYAKLRQVVAQQPYPLMFVTISGAHLYGFPSPDSDYDLRGAHITPLEWVLGMQPFKENIEASTIVEGVVMDVATHDISSYFQLLLKKSGNMLEQVFSPLIVQTTPEHDELRSIAPGLVTRFHAAHYLGMSRTQWGLFERERPRRVKPLLYVYRALLTGLHLMRTGEVEANLVNLNELFQLPQIPDLIARKSSGAEQSALDDASVDFHQREYERLRAELEAAQSSTFLPENPTSRDALNDLLLRVRYAQFRDRV